MPLSFRLEVQTLLAVILVVLLGGGLGSIIRFQLSRTLQPNGGVPRGTLVVNLVGAFAFGILSTQKLGTDWRDFLLVGTIGGLTTFSTLSYETFQLLRVGEVRAALVNVLGNFGGGLLTAYVGIQIGVTLR